MLTILYFVALLLSANADELRIARFDVKRVFDQYQHTKDLQAAINDKRFSRRPSDVDVAVENYETAKKRMDDARAAIGRTQSGTPERERTELQLQLATLAAQHIELRITLERTKREQTLKDESQRQRTELLQEIWTVASGLSSERGYRILVPDNLPNDGPFLTIVVSGATDDLTGPLLARLNEQYAAKKSK